MAAQRLTRKIAGLAWPILVGQLALIANGVIDTAMTARFSSEDLASLALGSSIYISVFVGFYGVLQALSPIIGQLFGAGRMDDIGREVRQGLWLAALLSIIGATLLGHPEPLLELAHATPAVSLSASHYLQWLTLALPATLIFRVYSALNNAISRPKKVMALNLIGLALKIPLNYLFIFGGFGLPALGGPGAAIATVTIYWLLACIALGQLWRNPDYRIFSIFGQGFEWPSWHAQRSLLKLGIPMGMSYLIEVTGFTFMTIFITRLGTTIVDGHQIIANLSAILYMTPLSIAYASGTLVAQAIGAGDLALARRTGNSGIRLAASLAVMAGALIWLCRAPIVRLYSPDPAVITAALPLITYLALYQLFDAIQVTTAFVLRAHKIAIVPTVLYAVALWGVGLGLGYVVGFDTLGLTPAVFQGASGFWLCNAVSLAMVATGLFAYLQYVHRHDNSAR